MSKKTKHAFDRTSRLLRLYDSLPKLDCKGLCTNSCGPIIGSRLERDRMMDAGGKPFSISGDLTCVYLLDGRCQIYEQRPMICRLWGMVKDQMECQHGCEPSRWLSHEEGKRLLREAQAIGGRDEAWERIVAQQIRAAVRPRSAV